MMNIFDQLDEMQQQILNADWSTFSQHYFSLCAEENKEVAASIRAVNLSDYLDSVKQAFEQSLSIAKQQNLPAIYFEYDLDNDWASHFFLCTEYFEMEAEDDDWACSYDHHIQAGTQEDFASIYNQTDKFCNTDEATAITLYLIARTTELLQVVIRESETPGIHICLGFHDQNPIHRLRIS